MLEESLVLENTDLYYRPVWTFDFDWAAKGKHGVIEIDGITGETRHRHRHGHVGMLVRGGGIAIKVARAALDKNY